MARGRANRPAREVPHARLTHRVGDAQNSARIRPERIQQRVPPVQGPGSSPVTRATAADKEEGHRDRQDLDE